MYGKTLFLAIIETCTTTIGHETVKVPLLGFRRLFEVARLFVVSPEKVKKVEKANTSIPATTSDVRMLRREWFSTESLELARVTGLSSPYFESRVA